MESQNNDTEYVLNTHLILSKSPADWGFVKCTDITDEEIAETWNVNGNINQILFEVVLMTAALKIQVDGLQKESERAGKMIETIREFSEFLNKELEKE